MRTFIFLAILLFVFQAAVLSQTRVYPSTRAQIETPIAINPTNPNNFIGAAITEVNSSFFKIGCYYSTNGGSTWLGSEDFSMDISAGDPVISFDPDGIAYIVFQVKDEKKLYMRKSTDGGVNWVPALGTNATEIFSVPGQDDILDKPWIAISPIRNSNGFFNIYITFTATYYEGSVKLPAAISLLKSTNGGSSFSSTGEFNNYDYHYLGSYVEVGPSGEVFVSYAKAEFTRSEVVSIQAARSTNQGSTFQNTVEIPVIQIGLYDDNAYALKAKSVRADCYPRIAVDRSPYSSGTAYLVWSAQAQEVGGNADIRMIKGSINSGQFSWNTSVISVDGSSGEQWMPAINVNPDGVLSVLYYSSGSNLNDPIYTKLRYSSNGGSNFTELNVGSANGFTITGYTFLGDYHGLTSWFGKAYGFWCEYKTDPTYDERQVYFRLLDIPVPSTPANYVKTIIDQKDESNQSFEKFSKWNQGQFTYYTPPIQFLFQNAANEVLRAKQDFKQSTYQKYHKWNLDNNVLNHRAFQIQTGITSIISQFKTSQQSIIIQNYFIDAPSLNPVDDKIKFIDPWFIDFEESPYGKRNRGMTEACPWERNSPFYPNFSTNYDGNTYQGVFLNQFIEEGLPYYSVAAISPQPIQIQHSTNPPITLNHNFYFQNWDGTNVSFQNAIANETGVVFTGENAVATANLKGTQLSSDENAYVNNSQRKFVRTPDGYYHHVYESLGTVWYERSSDNGQTWYLMNGGMPLELMSNAKTPSLDYLNNENVQCIVITYQRKSSTGSQVIAVVFDNGTRKYTYVVDSFTHPEIEYAEYNATPVVAISYYTATDYPQVLIVWKKPGLLPDESYPETEIPALYFSFGYLTRDYGQTSYSLNWHSLNLKKRIQTTNRYSLTPSMAIHKYNFDSHFQLAYEQSSQIYYWHCFFVWSAPGALFYGDPENVSGQCGFSSNSKPSIIAANQYYARVGWIGSRMVEPTYCWEPEQICGENEWEYVEQKVVFADPSYKGHYWNFGVNVQSTNLNKSIPKYVIAWSEGDNNGLIKFTDNSTLGGSIYATPNGLTGNYVQVSNAEENMVDMRVMSFNTNAQPFYFNSDQFYNAAKIKTLAISSGREGVVSKDSARFFFAVGDLKVNGQKVEFIEVEDTVSIFSKQRLNELLISKPFDLNDNSTFVYSVQYGITDSSAAVYVLDNEDFVNFKVELRDEQTGELLGLFDNITYTRVNVAQYNNIAYQVNTQGIGNRTVRLRLVTDNNFDPKYSLTDRYAEDNALLKSTVKQVGFQGSLAVDNYDLSQNYPNPFNPTTTINYQIKEDGLVTLKIYDILGAEVKTLVNEEKTKGRYTHNFNGSDLASGVYIYQLRVNDFVSSKKLVLIK